MTASAGVTVSDLLPAKFKRIDKAVEQALSRDPELEKAQRSKLIMGVVGEKATEAVRAALDCDVFGFLARAWAKARELHDYTDEAKHPADEISTLFLGEHDLTSEIHPVVDITVGALGKITLRFALELSAQFRMAEVTIRNKHIVEIGKSDCAVSALLKYDQIPLHDPVKSRKINLSHALALPAPGLLIL